MGARVQGVSAASRQRLLTAGTHWCEVSVTSLSTPLGSPLTSFSLGPDGSERNLHLYSAFHSHTNHIAVSSPNTHKRVEPQDLVHTGAYTRMCVRRDQIELQGASCNLPCQRSCYHIRSSQVCRGIVSLAYIQPLWGKRSLKWNGPVIIQVRCPMGASC